MILTRNLLCLLVLCAATPVFAEYIKDDGTSEDSLGLLPGGNVIYLNQFIVEDGSETIDSVSFAVGTPGAFNSSLVGSEATVHVWADTGTIGNPVDSTLLASSVCAITSVDNDEFIRCGVTPTIVGAPGESFFLGVQLSHDAGQFPIPVDRSSSARMSWVVGDVNTLLDPSDLGSATDPPVLLDSVGFAGNVLVRGSAVPEPGTYGLAMLAVSLLGMMLRSSIRGRRPDAGARDLWRA